MSLIVDNGAVPALVRHLRAPPPLSDAHIPYEHEVEKGSAFALGLLAIKVIKHFILFLVLFRVSFMLFLFWYFF